jgi:hypothetical protein
MCNWVEILSALLTPVVAVFGTIIALQQSFINRRRLKHELFDRRYKVYDHAKYFLSLIYANRTLTDQQIYDFKSETRECRFIFDDEIENIFNNWVKKAYEAKALNDELKPLPIGNDRSDNVRKQREIFDWFETQQNILVDKFTPYLRLKH